MGGAAGWEPRQRKRDHSSHMERLTLKLKREGVGEEGRRAGVGKNTEAFMATAAGQAG